MTRVISRMFEMIKFHVPYYHNIASVLVTQAR